MRTHRHHLGSFGDWPGVSVVPCDRWRVGAPQDVSELRHVVCCDNSPGRHATAHFGSRHPLIRSFEPGEEWFWCYVDDVAFELDLPPGPSYP